MPSRSNSVSSNTSNKDLLSSDNLQIFVNTTGGKSIKLNVRPVHSVANVLEFLSASTTLPSGSKLLRAGKPLDPSSTVGELGLSDSASLSLFTPLRSSQEPESSLEMTATLPSVATTIKTEASATSSGTSTPITTSSTPKPSTPRKSNKPRCSKQGCKTHAQPIVGDCGFCQQRFCGKHRMLESHQCAGLEDARQADKDRNTARLEGERTIMLRGL